MTEEASKTIGKGGSTTCIPLRPSAIISANVAVRYIFGSFLILILGTIAVPSGEYSQYIVSYEYAISSLVGWAAMIAMAILGYKVMGLIMRGSSDNKKRISVLSKYWLSRRENIEKLSWLCIMSGIAKLLFVVVAIKTGSEDRGSMYTYWAIQSWKPTSVFVALERCLSLFYVLAPVVVKQSRPAYRWGILTLYAVLTVASFSLSGRGTFLYPLLYTVIGLGIVLDKRSVLKSLVGFTVFAAVLIPTMAAVRDLPSYGGFGSKGAWERALLYVDSASYSDNLKRRGLALGREVYACSDGFVYRDQGSQKYGFQDLGLKDIVMLVIPRFLGGDANKMDGSSIAKAYMGVNDKTWFPCLTIQADLYRRGGAMAILGGGLIYGGMLFWLDKGWEYISRGRSMYCVVMTLLPITLVKSAPTGTVREVVVFILYEIVKYSILASIIAFSWRLSRRLCKENTITREIQ